MVIIWEERITFMVYLRQPPGRSPVSKPTRLSVDKNDLGVRDFGFKGTWAEHVHSTFT